MASRKSNGMWIASESSRKSIKERGSLKYEWREHMTEWWNCISKKKKTLETIVSSFDHSFVSIIKIRKRQRLERKILVQISPWLCEKNIWNLPIWKKGSHYIHSTVETEEQNRKRKNNGASKFRRERNWKFVGYSLVVFLHISESGWYASIGYPNRYYFVVVIVGKSIWEKWAFSKGRLNTYCFMIILEFFHLSFFFSLSWLYYYYFFFGFPSIWLWLPRTHTHTQHIFIFDSQHR